MQVTDTFYYFEKNMFHLKKKLKAKRTFIYIKIKEYVSLIKWHGFYLKLFMITIIFDVKEANVLNLI